MDNIFYPLFGGGGGEDFIPNSEKGVANGVATLDGTGKVPQSQISFDAVVYKGNWDASTNTPALASGVGTNGELYIVSVAGSTNLDGITDWLVGDYAIFNGTASQWQKIDNTVTQAEILAAIEKTNNATGWQQSGGTTSKTLIVSEDSTIDQDLQQSASPTFGGLTVQDSVGIGTTTLDEKLNVDGNVKATGFLGDGSNLTGIVPLGYNPFVQSLGWVAPNAPAGGNGSQSAPFNSIQDALDSVLSTGTQYFIVAPGTYTENITFPVGVVVKLIAASTERASFLGSVNSVTIDGTVTSGAGFSSLDGFTVTGLINYNAIGATLHRLDNCTVQGGITVSGGSNGNVVLTGSQVDSSVTLSSTINGLSVKFENCQGNGTGEIVCTTDINLLFVQNCSQMLPIDFRGNNLYINGLPSIGENASNITIKFRGPGGLANNTGIFSLLGACNLVASASAKLDINCDTLTSNFNGVVRNSGLDTVSYNTLVTPTAFNAVVRNSRLDTVSYNPLVTPIAF